MKKLDHHHGTIEQRLRACRLPAPTPELKERVLGAARNAWETAPSDDVPWFWPVLRLAACLMLASLPLIWVHSRHSLHPERAIIRVQETPAARQANDLWAMTGRPELARLRQKVAKPEANPAELLARHLKALAVEAGNLRANGG
jgi:hypothetical protein